MEGENGTNSNKGVALSVQTLVHIGLEALVISGVTIWLSKKISRLEDHVDHLSSEFTKKVAEKDEVIAALIKRQEVMEHLLVNILQNNPQLQGNGYPNQPIAYSQPQPYNPFSPNWGAQPQPQFESVRNPFQPSQSPQPMQFQPPMQPFQHPHMHPSQMHSPHMQHIPAMRFAPNMPIIPQMPPVAQFTPLQTQSSQHSNTTPLPQTPKTQAQPPKTPTPKASTPIPEENFAELDDILKEQLGNILFEDEEAGIAKETSPSDDSKKKPT
jgi:hypothetical protein